METEPIESAPLVSGHAAALETVVDGVRIPYLGLDTLIASKETYREQDRLDLLRLRSLKRS